MKFKILDRIAIILINIAIIIAMAVGPALILAGSPSYYRNQFEKNGIYSEIDEDGKITPHPIYFLGGESGRRGYFKDEQLNAIADHIVDFIFGDTESFELVMDDVVVNGRLEDDVRIFGDAAVTHMDDVKSLMLFGKWASIFSVILLPFLIAYVIWRRREMGRIVLQYSVIFFGALLLLLGGLCLISLINANGDFFSTFWEYAHHLFFPFNPEKVQGSFFNDTLTMILTLDLFMDAVIIVLSTLILSLGAWFAGAIIIYRKYGRQNLVKESVTKLEEKNIVKDVSKKSGSKKKRKNKSKKNRKS